MSCLRDLSLPYNSSLAEFAATVGRKTYKIKSTGFGDFARSRAFILLCIVFYLASVSSFVFSGSEEEETTEEGTTVAAGRNLFISALKPFEEKSITPTNMTIARSINTKEL